MNNSRLELFMLCKGQTVETHESFNALFKTKVKQGLQPRLCKLNRNLIKPCYLTY